MAITNIAAELKARGFFHEEGGGKAEEFLAEKRKVYLGMDPSAESLQIGNLVPIMLMKHLSDAGHDIMFIIGGGTGMIGDPRASGERVLLDQKAVAKNVKAVQAQLSKIIGKRQKIVNNLDWLGKLSLIEFLRDTGKHFTVNQLVKREIIKKRLDSEDPISFTEFSYSLLQGYDFWYLFKKYGIDMQIGGSDQWANIISGVDLIRKREGKSVYALTLPIIIDKATGKKFGKSEGNAVWLDPMKTSPYAFYQFWLNVQDESFADYLKIFSFLPLAEIDEVVREHDINPQARVGQKRLAHEVTTIVHGKAAAESAARISEILFGEGSLASLERKDIDMLKREAPVAKVKAGSTLIDALVAADLATSKGEARRLIEQNAVSLNSVAVAEVGRIIAVADFHSGMCLVRRGKKVALLVK